MLLRVTSAVGFQESWDEGANDESDVDCDEPECLAKSVAQHAQKMLCEARTRAYIERGDGRLPATVAFPILLHKGYLAEPVYVETFQDLG